jgi:hypothetical protein
MLTGARISALASFRLAQGNLTSVYVEQDARSVRTNFGKTFRTYTHARSFVSGRSLNSARFGAR